MAVDRPDPKAFPRQRALARRMAGEAGMEKLEGELLAEMAAALGRSESHVVNALEQLAELGRRLDESGGCAPDELERRVAEFNAVRDEAERRRWELIVHREAIGFRRSDAVERLYPIPRPRRARST
jgi:hypothetical protein